MICRLQKHNKKMKRNLKLSKSKFFHAYFLTKAKEMQNIQHHIHYSNQVKLFVKSLTDQQIHKVNLNYARIAQEPKKGILIKNNINIYNTK